MCATTPGLFHLQAGHMLGGKSIHLACVNTCVQSLKASESCLLLSADPLPSVWLLPDGSIVFHTHSSASTANCFHEDFLPLNSKAKLKRSLTGRCT